jgi:hypothetical protein
LNILFIYQILNLNYPILINILTARLKDYLKIERV